MLIHPSLTSWLVSLVKAQACLLILCGVCASAGDTAPPQQLTTGQLKDLLLPPVGWKFDREVLRTHFWMTHAAGDDLPGEQRCFTVYPFWPAFFELWVQEGHVKQSSPGWYAGELGELLSDALESPDPAIQKKAALWLRQNLLLYFAGFRLSRIDGQRPYAPWIKPEDARRLDQMADAYVASQKVMRAGKEQQEISALLLTGWITHPRSTALADVVSYYDMLQASHESIAVDHIYPVRWVWGRTQGNLTMVASTSIDSDMLDLHSHRLLPGTLPDSSNPVCLWLRDVYLSYIAGKQLLEARHLRLKDEKDEPLLKDALQQWWAEVEKQQPQQ